MAADTGKLPTSPLCVCCESVLDGYAVAIGGEGGLPMPRPGDFTVCFYCRTLMVFTDDLGLRGATQDEERELRAEWPGGKAPF